MTRRTTLALTCAAAGLVLSACGTTQPSAEEETDDTGDSTSEAASGPISVTDQAGRTVELDAAPERVVVLEWGQTESVLSLGVEPVGVADVDGYITWDTAEELDPETTDVGVRGEPNLDAVFSENPDLVIVEATRGDPIIRQLEEYDVPILVTEAANAEDPVGTMKETHLLIGQALGREDDARADVEEFEAAVEEGREAIDAADPENRSFTYVDAYADGANVAIRPFGQGSQTGEIGEELGLENAWTGEVDDVYGLGNTDVEGMTAVSDSTLLYTGTESDPWLSELERNPVWEDLAFVREDRVEEFPPGIWTFGGPGSSMQLVDAYVAAFGG
ncbi:iron-siderophore ABC transporter substrate-binding protein [Nocardioides sp. CFH 31398]|uniref:ABC transporter substrate-binding protein n=1 Tax=Nocardioides sp. CFH 31398 TaxID=2919579 RepID=UPI001F061A3C|nr:iron-siderophore ABC transporter substrate-binding protein [Nocardioides sp. CFH 31398]MCH1867138.1 iron-siderophore ABC transporter substrate-binding protein [Nocardioides sp. CFH 31398]